MTMCSTPIAEVLEVHGAEVSSQGVTAGVGTSVGVGSYSDGKATVSYGGVVRRRFLFLPSFVVCKHLSKGYDSDVKHGLCYCGNKNNVQCDSFDAW